MDSPAGLNARVAAAFYGRFPELRPAQEAAIAPLLAGKNVVLSSGTGSGKTEAVMAPLTGRYWKDMVVSDALTILYIAPTKALANDLEKRLIPPLNHLGLRVGIRHGDRDDVVSGPLPHILVTTPESLEVMLFRKDAALKTIRAVVIDEVHLLYNTQRGLQLSILLRRLRKFLGDAVQWAAISATIGRLENVRDFLFGDLEKAALLSFSATRDIVANVRYIEDGPAFLELIRRIISTPRKLLVFANSRRECEALAGLLQQEEGLRDCVFTHYSSLSAEVRVETERAFAAQPIAICIATSTLELGIDIGDIDAVLLWGVPASIESFLQRIGRSNRRIAKTNVICLIPPDSADVTENALRFLALIESGRKGEMPVSTPHDLYGAVGQQCLSIIHSADEWFTRVADLCEMCNHRDYLNRSVLESILAQLVHGGYIQPHGFKNRYGPDERLHQLVDYRMIYGNFAAGSQEIEVRYQSKVLGLVPATNLLRLSRSDKVRFNGQCWRVQKTSPEGFDVEPTSASPAALDFTYGGSGVRPDPFLVNRVWEMIHSDEFPSELLAEDLREQTDAWRAGVRAACGPYDIPFRCTWEGCRYLTYGGYLVNKATALITRQVNFQADDVSLVVPTPIQWNALPTDPRAYEPVFSLLFEESSQQSLFQTLLPADLQRREYLQGWLKDETIPKILARLANARPVEVDALIW